MAHFDFRGILDYIKTFFVTAPETNRKRRAVDPVETLLSPKCRRLHSTMSRNVIDLEEENYFPNPKLSKRSVFKTPPSRIIGTIVLDDEVENRKPLQSRFQNRSGSMKFTSTPDNSTEKPYMNGTDDDDDDVAFVGEINPSNRKNIKPSKLGMKYNKPFSESLHKYRTLENDLKSKNGSAPFNGLPTKANNTTRSSLDYSFCLEDKLQYKKLLESSGIKSPDNSCYGTPLGKIFNSDRTSRSHRILDMALKPTMNTAKDRLTVRERMLKVLDKIDEPVLVKDSDSESDIIFVDPPSPKPDIRVEPVNSFKKVVESFEPLKTEWLDRAVNRHRKFVEQRQQEIDILRECSERHGKINKDMRMDILTEKVNRALSLREAVLPVEERVEEVELPPLTTEHLKMVEKTFRGDPNEVLARKFNLNITRRDLLTLAGLNWLNDEVINFYMNLIIERGKDSKWPKVYAFNTFFYSKLIKDGPQSLRRWTKRIDIFSHDLVCVPIHLGMHWCMAVIDFRDKSIRYYDSMGGNNKKCLDALRKYLEAEHLDKKQTTYDTSDFTLENVKDIPQQMNGSDCGMFSCTFAEFLSRNAKIAFSQEHMPYFRKKMVVEILTGELLIQ